MRGGRGGRGCVAFRREKFVPRGGPSGGDGGHGGSVWLVAEERVQTLLAFKYNPTLKGERGGHGEGSDKHGRAGADVERPVPVGTVVLEDATGLALCDLDLPGARYRVATGGRGGRGNARFASATNRAPRVADPGEKGEERILILELKVLADIGLVGLPNAGKSTLLSRLTSARPKIAAYPFTTLFPNLGVVEINVDRSLVIADIPGLIEGAHTGTGLGHQFLKHLERTRVLLHLIDVADVTETDPVAALDAIAGELQAYSASLLEKPRLVVATKIDAAEPPVVETLERACGERGLPFAAISSVTGENLPGLLRQVDELYSTARPEVAS